MNHGTTTTTPQPFYGPFSSFPSSLLFTALGDLCLLPVLQRLGDAYGF